jgi:hypothetical protein
LSQSLKALALVKSGKIEEASHLCDELVATEPTDDLLLNALTHVLRSLTRREQISHFDDRDVTSFFAILNRRRSCRPF